MSRKLTKATKDAVVRKLIDVIVGIVAFAAVWLINRSLDQGVRLTQVEHSVGALVKPLETLTVAVENLAEQQRALILVATFRADPWSGEMARELQAEWFTLFQSVGFEIQYADLPDIDAIQERNAGKLIPEGLFHE